MFLKNIKKVPRIFLLFSLSVSTFNWEYSNLYHLDKPVLRMNDFDYFNTLLGLPWSYFHMHACFCYFFTRVDNSLPVCQGFQKLNEYSLLYSFLIYEPLLLQRGKRLINENGLSLHIIRNVHNQDNHENISFNIFQFSHFQKCT